MTMSSENACGARRSVLDTVSAVLQCCSSGNLVASSATAKSAATTAIQACNVVEEAATLTSLLRSSVEDGRSHSVMLVGPACVDAAWAALHSALSTLSEVSPTSPVPYQLVHLDAALHSSSGNLALMSICDQLNLSTTSLCDNVASYNDNLAYVLRSFRESAKHHLPVIFIISEFDRFASPNKQSLLYNLLDLVHSSSVHLAVVCMTSRIDAFDLLEKRVRSRVSNRRIVFPNKLTFEHVEALLRSLLSLRNVHECDESYIRQFREHVACLMSSKAMNQFIRVNVERGRSLTWFLWIVNLIMAFLSDSEPFPTQSLFEDVTMLVSTENQIEMINDFAIPELIVLTSMIHLERRGIVPYTFEAVYHEYHKWELTRQDAFHLSKSVCLAAFERILEMQVAVRCVRERITDDLKRLQKVRLIVHVDDIEEAINENDSAAPWLKQWLTSLS